MNDTLGKCIFLSIKQQKIIFQMFNNGNRINYREQKIYKTELNFNHAMNILFESGAVNLTITDDFYNEYVLTKAGRFLCEHGIIPIKVKE